MYKRIAKTTPISLGFLGLDLKWNMNDNVSPDKKAMEEYHRLREAQKPLERLKTIYSIK